MSKKTRKHIWPVSLAMSIAIVGALAAFLVLSVNPGATNAHGPSDHPNQGWPVCADMTDAQRAIHDGIHANVGAHGTMDGCSDGTPPERETMTPATGDRVTSSSSTGSGAPEIKLIIESMPDDMSVGSSIVLYLEDDFQEPDSISTARSTSLRKAAPATLEYLRIPAMRPQI